MSDTEKSASDVIDAYRKRRERLLPLILGGLAVVLLVVGVFLIVIYFSGDNSNPLSSILASPTPTASQTSTPLPPTATATITITPEPTLTPTPEGPRSYIIQLDDTLWEISLEFEVSLELLIAYNNIEDVDNVPVGTEIIIPEADAELPTPTALPLTLVPGDKITYVVAPGDTLQTIAAQFNSTGEAIAEENEIEDVNAIGIGQILIIPVQIATPTQTSPPPALTNTPEA
jgi:LysM repeat protein